MRAKRPRWIERSSGVVAVVVVPIVPYISQVFGRPGQESAL